jgi:type IV pilus assembly protein PilF
MRQLVAVLVLALAAGCTSTSSTESRPVTDSGGADARRRAEVHTALAGEYYARGAYTVALGETRAAIKDDSSYYAAYSMQGLVFMELKEDVLAREAFDRALSLSPNNSEVLNNFGWFLCLRNDAPRGLPMMLRAATDTQNPTPEKAWLSIGLCQRRHGKNVEAEEALRRAVQIRPDMIGALYNLALITFERGAYKDAEIYLVRYARLSSPTLEALVLGVKVSRANGDKAGEESYMQQLRRRFPDSPEFRELEARK